MPQLHNFNQWVSTVINIRAYTEVWVNLGGCQNPFWPKASARKEQDWGRKERGERAGKGALRSHSAGGKTSIRFSEAEQYATRLWSFCSQYVFQEPLWARRLYSLRVKHLVYPVLCVEWPLPGHVLQLATLQPDLVKKNIDSPQGLQNLD